MTLARLFIFFGSLLVLALFTALIAPPFINWTNYREDFEREATRILGEEVVVHGTADARLLPFPSVTFNDVEVGPRDGGEPMMQIARFTMDAELAPFLSGEFRIFDMRIEEPDIRLSLDGNGNLDWANRSRADLPGGTVILERVEISDGTLRLDDSQTGRLHTIENIQSVLSADSLAGPWRVQGTAALAGQTGAFSLTTGALDDDGSIRLNTRILPDRKPVSLELQGSAGIEEGRPRYEGNFTLQVLDIAGNQRPAETDAATRAQPALRGTGMFALGSQRLRVDEYRLEVGATDDPYVVEGEATIDAGEAPEFLLVANGQQIDVDRLARKGGAASKAGRPQPDAPEPVPLSATERLAAFRRIAEAVPIPDLPGRISLSLPAVIAGETTFREVSLEARPQGDHWQIDNFAASLPGRTRLEASGSFTMGDEFGFAGNMLLASNQPSGFAAWFTEDVNPAIRRLRDAGFEADVELTERVQRFDNLELVVGNDRLQGSFSRTRRENSSALAADLTGDRFDLDALRALAGLFTDGSDDSLGGDDISAHLRVDEFAAYGLDMKDVDTTFSLQDGLIDIANLSIADVAGAAIEARGVFSDLTGAPQGNGRMTLRSANPRPLLELADRHLGAYLANTRLAARASLFSDTDLTATLDLGSARDTETAATTGYGLTIEGQTGGTRIAVDMSSDTAIRNALNGGDLSLKIDANNDSARPLIAQLGLPVLPFETGTPLALSLTLDGDLSDAASVELALSNEDTQLSAQGDVTASAGKIEQGQWDITLNSRDAEPYLLLAGIGLPGFGTGLPVELATRLSADPRQWSLAGLEGNIGGNGVRGDLALQRAADTALTGDLAVDTMDLGWLAEGFFGLPLRGVDGEWSDAEFAAVADIPVSLDIGLTADRAFVGFAEAAQEFAAQISYRSGELRISEASAHWLGGTLDANLRLANVEQTGTVALRLDLADANVARALTPVGGEAPASGIADLSLSLEGAGKSARTIAGALTGSGALQLSDLTIDGFEDDALQEILTAADADGFEITADAVRPIAQDAIADGSIHVDQVSVPLTIAAGTARATNIVMESGAVDLRGDIRLALTDARLSAQFEAMFDAGDQSLPGASPALGLTLAGPVFAPETTVDATQMSNFLSLRAYERERRRVERVQAAVLEKQRLRREAAYIREQMDRRETRRRDEEVSTLREEAWREAVERARNAPLPFDLREESVPLPEEAPAPAVEQPDEAPPSAPTAPVAPPQEQQQPTWQNPAPQPVPSLDFDALPGVEGFN